jgi:hypothetical protein
MIADNSHSSNSETDYLSEILSFLLFQGRKNGNFVGFGNISHYYLAF